MTDHKFAFRQLAKRPGSTVIILSTLALVIGTLNLTLGVIQHEHSMWMPFPQPEQMFRVWRFDKERHTEHFPAAIYREATATIQGVEALAGLGGQGLQVLTGEGEPRTLSMQHVTASASKVVGIQPLFGRWFTAEEQRAGREDLLIISYAIWQSVFQGDPSAVGKVVQLNDVPCTILGVMPEGFERNALFYGLDAWLLRDFESASAERESIRIAGRRKQGVAASELNAEMGAALPRLLAGFWAGRGWDAEDTRVSTLPLGKRPQGKDAAAIITGVSICVFVLAIAVFNLANVLLGSMLARRHEFAVRFSLGAKRRRIIRQLLSESVLLSLLGAGAGGVGAYWVGQWAATYEIHTQFSPAVVGATALAAVVLGIAIGWLPALRATKGDFLTELRESGGAATGGSGRHRLRNFLVIGQVAMATALCIAAGLLVRSYLNQRQYDPGFDTRRMMTISASLHSEVYSHSETRLGYRWQALEQIRALPGVEEAGFSSDRLIYRVPFPTSFRLDGEDSWRQGQMVSLTAVSPNYLSMIGLPVLRGRGLEEADRLGTPAVAVVNQSFVDRYFSGADAIGRRIGVSIEATPDWLTIVGVVPDRRNLGHKEEIGPEAYLSADQFAPSWSSTLFIVRTKPNPEALREGLRNAIQSVDRNVPVHNASTLDSQIEQATRRNIGGMRAFGAIGLFGLIMATLGIYGVVGYSVTERTRELGIRMALGATRGVTLRLLVMQCLRHVFIGLAAGIALGIVTALGLREILYGTRPFDLPTYGAVVIVMCASSLLATLIPARRALRIDPMEALRYE